LGSVSVTSRSFQFHPEAELEFVEAAEWYEERKPGLGAEFVASVRVKIDGVRDVPERWPTVRGVRRAFVGRFPYAVVYRETADATIEIVAVAHFSRKPRYWSAR
jgi:plasmid stabilization system protein ParE